MALLGFKFKNIPVAKSAGDFTCWRQILRSIFNVGTKTNYFECDTAA